MLLTYNRAQENGRKRRRGRDRCDVCSDDDVRVMKRKSGEKVRLKRQPARADGMHTEMINNGGERETKCLLYEYECQMSGEVTEDQRKEKRNKI